MLTPTTAELLNAIEVLNKLGERINTTAVNSVLQLSETSSGDHNAGRIEVNAIEQTSRIKIVAEQLQNWRNELIQQRRQNVSQSV
jgi:glutaminase